MRHYCHPLVFRSTLLIVIFLTGSRLSAQKEFSQWILGNRNGIDFRSGTPVAITSPTLEMFDYRALTTRCDANGNLLFYSDGSDVYNAQHQIMPNGSGLNGNRYASQGVLTVRAMHDTTLFYLFTVDYGGGTNPMSYSVVDMKADNGSGAVTIKNVPLLSDPTEQLAAAKHCNGRDVWVITHQSGSDAYYAYLVTPSGISNTPVISRSGRQSLPDMWTNSERGHIKISPDGKKIAASFEEFGIDLSDFDNTTGIVSSSISLPVFADEYTPVYGVEFSPNSRFLYTTNYEFYTSSLYQLDVLAGSPADIASSKTTIAQQSLAGNFEQLQLGPDNKIYVSDYGTTHVSVIHQPDVAGVGCDFELEGLQLIGGSSSPGLPSYIDTRFDPAFTYTAGCPPQHITFNYDKPSYVTNVQWDFGDLSSGAANSSTEMQPIHVYTSAGSYSVTLIRYMSCTTDTLEQTITVGELSVNLGSDTALCTDDAYVLSPAVTGNNLQFLWQDGSTSNNYRVATTGAYTVNINDGHCEVNDTINIQLAQSPQFDLGVDKMFCPGDQITLGENLTGSNAYTWDNGSTSSTRIVGQPGTYTLTATNSCGTFTDAIVVKPGGCVLAVPNAFSPNNDGKNDVFMISQTTPLADFTLQIFNRWGQKIFESRDQHRGWNGTAFGKKSEVGNYPYFIQYRNADGTLVILKGMLLLTR